MDNIKAKIAEYRNKLLFGFLSAGKAPCTFGYNQSIGANAAGTFTVTVPQNLIFMPQFIAVKSTGLFTIVSILMNNQNYHYGDPISSDIFTQYTAFPLQWNALIPNNAIIQFNLQDTSGVLNNIKILLSGYSLPAQG